MNIQTSGAYEPVAVYYDLADSVEYMRRDEPCVYRRVDDHLTLAFDLERSAVIGFRLKGFKNFYLRELAPVRDFLNTDFLSLVAVVEKVAESLARQLGSETFDEKRREAYKQVREMAQQDNVKLSDLPTAA